MAVAIEFINVIVRKSAVEKVFPGGLDGFARQDLANLTEDDHLMRVGFMDADEAHRFVIKLDEAGLRFLGSDSGSDIAVFGWDFSQLPPWLSADLLNNQWACWENEYPVGEVVYSVPGFLLRCSQTIFRSLTDVVRDIDAKISRNTNEKDSGYLARLLCTRGDAEILIDVVGTIEDETPIGLLGRRQLSRRKQFQTDVDLIHDLVSTLQQYGAENG